MVQKASVIALEQKSVSPCSLTGSQTQIYTMATFNAMRAAIKWKKTCGRQL
jgi:hypothetical protein